MMETRKIVALWRRQGAGAQGVLVTLIRAEGSSYRRPGARLLLVRSGESAGTISGGCLEAEVVRKAFWKVRAGAVVETYSTTFDDTAEIPYGLGCGGTVDLLLEPVETVEGAAVMAALEASLRGDVAEISTWLPKGEQRLRREVRAGDGRVLFASEGLVEGAAVYSETIAPPQRLVVLGAGEDARPLVALAALLGWRITVAEGRGHLAKAERFPAAEEVVRLASNEIAGLKIGADDAVVVMTHSFEQDRELLAAVLPIAPRYLGLLGARHRSSLLLKEASERAGLTVEQGCARVFAPVGLDLGGDGPEAIALAVMAEMQAVCTGRRGVSRRLSAEDVAEQLKAGGAERYLEAGCALDLPA